MSENPRDLIRAAQSAELQGDVKRAVDCLKRAAELYQKAGNAARALQLLRHARKLDGSRVDIAEEVNRLEWMPETLLARPEPGDDEDSRLASELVRAHGEEPLPELVRRQRLIEDALREASARVGGDEDAASDSTAWLIETEVAEDLQRLEAQLARVAASVDAETVARAGGVGVSPVEAVKAAVSAELEVAQAGVSSERDVAGTGGPMGSAKRPVSTEPGVLRTGAADERDVARTSETASEVARAGRAGDARADAPAGGAMPRGPRSSRMESAATGLPGPSSEALPGELEAGTASALQPEPDAWRPAPEGAAPETGSGGLATSVALGAEDAGPEVPTRRRREKRLIERGPTRADAALDAWCSFCCRPRSEVGDLVAGPTGSFICAGCLAESVSLLGDVTPAQPHARRRPVEPPGAFMALVGQAEAQALLERALHTGARCLLAVGPEGCGKSVWFQQIQRQGRGVLASLATLEQVSSPQPLLIEDVDRMPPEAHASLVAFLSNHPWHTVILSARGLAPEARGPVLRSDSGALPVPTTAALAQAVRNTVPVSLLEHVQTLLPLHAPTQAELLEIARKRLALREPAVSLSDDVLNAFAAEAARSPRAGHELHALLNRVPSGTWTLENTAKPAAAPRKGRRKGSG